MDQKQTVVVTTENYVRIRGYNADILVSVNSEEPTEFITIRQDNDRVWLSRDEAEALFGTLDEILSADEE